MKSITLKVHQLVMGSLLLLLNCLGSHLMAQSPSSEIEKVEITIKKTDKTGRKTVQKITKKGNNLDDEAITQLIQDALAEEEQRTIKVDVETGEEGTKIIKTEDGNVSKEIIIDADGKIKGMDKEDVFIFKTEDGEVIELNDKATKDHIKIFIDDEKKGDKIWIEKDEGALHEHKDGDQVFFLKEGDGDRKIIKKRHKVIKKEKKEDIEAKLEKMGIKLPEPSKPVANYVNAVRTENLIFMAGKGPRKMNGQNITGKVGKDLSIEEGYQAARITAINQLAALKAEIGDLNRVKRIIKVTGMVNAAPDFTDHPQVINGFSDFMVEVFGDRGKHARAAVGMSSLPGDIAVEIEMVVEIE